MKHYQGGVPLLVSLLVAACGAQIVEFPIDVPADQGVALAPEVTSTTPLDGSLGVAIDATISATFSNAMDPATLIAGAFTVTGPGATLVSGTVTYDGFTATFLPDVDLPWGTHFTATITTDALDVGGVGLDSDYLWEFDTRTEPGVDVPTVLSTVPADAAANVLVDQVLTATFSEPMIPSTVTVATFQVTGPGTAPVWGSVVYTGTTATFTPADYLPEDTHFTATITAEARNLAGTALASPYVWHFDTETLPGPVAPTVVSTSPVADAVGVLVGSPISATFSEAMLPSTVTVATFQVTGPAAIPIWGTVNYVGTTATFIPANDLPEDTHFTATITAEARNLAGTALANDYVWHFDTETLLDNLIPTVISTVPMDGATEVGANSPITATFSEVMNGSTLNGTSFVITGPGGTSVTGAVTYLGTTATFAPASPLVTDTLFTATVTTAAEDLAGNPLAVDYVWTFTTVATPDSDAPLVLETDPMHEAIEVPTDVMLSATFDEAMDPNTLTTLTFVVEETQSANPVLGSVAYDVQNFTVTFMPEELLLPDTEYTASITDLAMDLAGNGLVVPPLNDLPVPNPWTFHTAADIVIPPPLAIDLRGLESYGLASRAGLTSTGITVVDGDVALWPLPVCVDATGNAGASQTCLVKTYASPTGMTVTGSIYFFSDPFDNGGTANAVTNDLTIAWVAGKDMIDTLGPVAGDELGGKTFAPGVYHNATLGLAAGSIAVMDANNDPNAIFVFKIDSSFVDSGTLLLPTRVDLANGAQARNVWFVAGLDITVGSGTIWNGTILAGRDATVLDGSTVNGRVLAGASGAGAVVLTGAASPSLTTIIVPQ